MTKIRTFLVLVAMLIMALFTCRVSAKTEIVAVHDGFLVLVKNPPLTEAGAVRWWQNHRNYLKSQYNIPRDESTWSIGIMDFGEGYRTDRGTDQDSDLLCFKDMHVKDNYIEKRPVLHISKGINGMSINNARVKGY